ncbi:unnamed protein product [Prorocentrum cordatum]|uniref:Uncharacterized protein n=1 Tax=Prorocentrum cordatum TaxID=2364126 RepID=A0ABN9RRL7_9DINO|nr:unnamed protein product [Polarella glacialis]
MPLGTTLACFSAIFSLCLASLHSAGLGVKLGCHEACDSGLPRLTGPRADALRAADPFSDPATVKPCGKPARWIPSEFNRADSPSRRFTTYADVADEARLDQLRARAARKKAFAAGGHGGGCGSRGPPPHEADSAPAAAPRRSLRDGKSPAGPSHGRCGDAPPGAADRASSRPDAGPRCTGVEAVAPGAPGTSRRSSAAAETSMTGARAGGLSLLEYRSVGKAMQKRYRVTFDSFMDFAEVECLETASPAEVDLAALEYLDFRYLEGDRCDVGNMLLGAVLFCRADVANLGRSSLPRLRRALRGFRKAAPPASRLPLPWEWCAALAAAMQWRGHVQAAIALVTSFDTYIRPGALMSVRVGDVLQPVAAQGMDRWGIILFPQERGAMSKTGAHDDAIIFGNHDVDTARLVRFLMGRRSDDEMLFPIGMRLYKKHFDQACVDLGLDKFRLVTYQARRGGATRDILLQRRTLEETRKRGTWETYSSLRRYEKSGRVQKVMQSTPPHLLAFAKLARGNLEEWLLGVSRALARLGVPTLVYEILYGPGADVSQRAVQDHILDFVRSASILFVWIGLPCTTYSRARAGGAGPGPVRSTSRPLGLDGLSAKDVQKIADANALTRFTIRLLKCCRQHNVRAVLENPRTSILWHVPGIRRLQDFFGFFKVEVDYCRYGAKWRKGTTLLCNFEDATALEAKCKVQTLDYGGCSR